LAPAAKGHFSIWPGLMLPLHLQPSTVSHIPFTAFSQAWSILRL
jgi:hypothetical protein